MNTIELRKALRLHSRYRVITTIDASYQDPDLGRRTSRTLYTLRSATAGTVDVYAAATADGTVLELGHAMFLELARIALGL